MSAKKYNDFDVLDDYFEDEGDSFLFNEAITSDFSDVSYEDFNKVTDDYDEEEDDDEVVYNAVKTSHTTKSIKKSNKRAKTSSLEERIIENESLMNVLLVFWIWFRRLGIVIAVILIAYYLVHGYFKDLFAYLFALILAFGFGFCFMAVLTKVKENR